MNFMENFNALFDQSFFVFLDTKLFEQVVPGAAHAALTTLCLYAPKVGNGWRNGTRISRGGPLGQIVFSAVRDNIKSGLL